MEWIGELFNTIIEGFNAIVDMLILLHNNLVNATQTIQAQIQPQTRGFVVMSQNTLVFECIEAFKYVVGDFLFNTTLTLILFSISYATYKFIKELRVLIWGEKGLLEDTKFFKLIGKFFKK